ncbi:TIR domain-containing protein [Aliiroseovarius sp. M344]|nr:TIR domain-containing protein [Aliiroseovarius sp. M344]
MKMLQYRRLADHCFSTRFQRFSFRLQFVSLLEQKRILFAMFNWQTASVENVERGGEYSIPDHNPVLDAKGTLLTGPRLLAKAIQTRIQQSSVLLVPARMFTAQSDWVTKEID